MLIDLNIYKNKEDIPYKEKDIICFREQLSGGIEDYLRVWKTNIVKSENGYRVLIPSITTFALPNYAMKKAIPNLVVNVIDTLILTDLQKQEQTCINTLKILRELRRNKQLMRIVNVKLNVPIEVDECYEMQNILLRLETNLSNDKPLSDFEKCKIHDAWVAVKSMEEYLNLKDCKEE